MATANGGNGRQLQQPQAEYDRHSVLGNLLDDDDQEDIPLLYFNTIPQAWRWLTSWAIPGRLNITFQSALWSQL